MSHQTNSNFSYGQSGHAARWCPASIESTASTLDSSLCGISPIVITPDRDIDCVTGSASKESHVEEEEKNVKPLNAVLKNMMQFQVQEQPNVTRRAQHTLFADADYMETENPLIDVQLPSAPSVNLNQLSVVPLSSCPASGNQFLVASVMSGNQVQISSMVMSEANAVFQTPRQLTLYPAGGRHATSFVEGSSGVRHHCAIGDAYLSPSFGCSTTSYATSSLNTGPNMAVPETCNQLCIAAPSVRLQTSRGVSQKIAMPICSSGYGQPQQRFRNVTSVQQQDRILGLPVPSLQAPHPLPYVYSQSPGLQNPTHSALIARQPAVPMLQTRNASGFHELQNQELPKSQTLPLHRSTVSDQPHILTSMSLRSSDDQNMQRRVGDRPEQSFADQADQASGRKLQQQGSVRSKSGFSFYNQDPDQNVKMLWDDTDVKEPVGANFQLSEQVCSASESLYGDAIVRSQSLESSQSMQQWAVESDNLSGQASVVGQPQSCTSSQPHGSLGGQNFQSQISTSGLNFQLGGPNFQPQNSTSGLNFQLQSSLDGQNFQAHHPLSGHGQTLLPQASLFGNTFLSQNLLDIQNMQLQRLLHGSPDLQEQNSVGAHITQNMDVSMQRQPFLQNQQLPRSAEVHSEHILGNQPSAENPQTPESVSSSMQHQLNSLFPGQQAQNPMGMNPELNQFMAGQPLSSVMLQRVTDASFPVCRSLSDGSVTNPSASPGLPLQTCSAVAGTPGAVASQLVQSLYQQPLQQVQPQIQQQQQQMQQQQQEMQQQQMQQVQQQMQQEIQRQQLQQQLLQQLQQQQLLQQLQSNFGVLWPGMAPGCPNQTPLVNNAPPALSGYDLLSQLLPLLLGNLPPNTLLSLLSQSLPALSNSSLGNINPFSMPQNQIQQQIAAFIAQSLRANTPNMGLSGLDTNQFTSVLCQMLSAVNSPTPASALPAQPILSQSGDGAAGVSAMQGLLQSLRGPDMSSSEAGQQFVQNQESCVGSKPYEEASLADRGSRPASSAGLGLEVSQQIQVPPSVNELSIQSFVEQVPTVATPTKKSSSTDVSPTKHKKHKPKGRPPKKKNCKNAAGFQDKSTDLHDANDLTGHQSKPPNPTEIHQDDSDIGKNEEAGGVQVKIEDNSWDLNPSVYIDVAWDPNCSPTKSCSVKLLDVSDLVIENGRRSVTKLQQKLDADSERGIQSVNKVSDGSLAVGRKRKGDETDRPKSSRKKDRLYSEEESGGVVSDHLEYATKADSLCKGKLESLGRGGKIAMLSSRGRGGRIASHDFRGQAGKGVTTRAESGVTGPVGRTRSGAFKGKATSISHDGGGGNLAKRTGPLQNFQRKSEERASHLGSLDKDDIPKISFSDDSSISPSDLVEASSKSRTVEESVSHPESLDKDDSSNVSLPDDSSGSSTPSDLVDTASNTRKAEERVNDPGSLDQMRKAKERMSHPVSLDIDDSSNVSLPDDSSGSSTPSDLVDLSSNSRKAEERVSDSVSLDKDDNSNVNLPDDGSGSNSPSDLADTASNTREAEEKMSHPVSLDKDDRSNIHLAEDSFNNSSPSDLVDTSSKTRKNDERASHLGSLDKDDSANISSPSDLVDSLAKGPQEQERNKNLLQCAKDLAISSMPELSLVSTNSVTKPDSKTSTDQGRASEVLGVRKCRLKQMALKSQAQLNSDSDDNRHNSFSDSSSNEDFVSPRDSWKPKSKATRKATSLGRGFHPRKKLAVTSKTKQHTVVASDQRNVLPSSAVMNSSTEENKMQRSLSSVERTVAPSSEQIPLNYMFYPKRGRGRPSLFQTFQTELTTISTTSAPSDSTINAGRNSPPMPVLTKETPVRAVARVSPLAPVGCDDMLKEKLGLIKLRDNVNTHIESQLQTVFVKLDESSDTMNVLISFRKAEEGGMVFQCTFCPFADFSAKVVSDHVRRLHSGLMFAATRTPMPTGDLIYLFCRHCSFVTHDRISMWIHFEVSHGIANIVYGSDVTDVIPPASRRLVLSVDQQAITPSFYQCLDCEIVVADNRHIAEHVVKNHHENSSCYRGCFAKARVINKPKSAPIQVTYGQLLGSEYADQRKEVFICVHCSYIAYTEFLAISHHILSHLDLKMLFVCHNRGCNNRELSSEAAIRHLRTVHADVSTRILRGTVTLFLQSTYDSSPLHECLMLNSEKGSGNKTTVSCQMNLAKLANSTKTTVPGVEKSSSTMTRGESSVAPAVEDSTPERQSSASVASKHTEDKKKAKQARPRKS